MSVAFKWRRNEITCRLRQRDKNHDGYREPETCEADQVLVGVMIFIVCVLFFTEMSVVTSRIFIVCAIATTKHWKSGSVQRCPTDQIPSEQSTVAADAFISAITTAFTGLRPADARITENPPAATPVQRFVMPFSLGSLNHMESNP